MRNFFVLTFLSAILVTACERPLTPVADGSEVTPTTTSTAPTAPAPTPTVVTPAPTPTAYAATAPEVAPDGSGDAGAEVDSEDVGGSPL